MRSIIAAIALTAIISMPTQGADPMDIPNDFPRFKVPGYDKQMQAVRELYWLHYGRSGPMATLWDQWLVPPSVAPAVETDNSAASKIKAWDDVLSSRIIDKDGYVSVHQHASIAHPLGWPFPFWNQGTGGIGWHFSFKDTVGGGWRQDELSATDGWAVSGADDGGIDENGWNLKLTAANAHITAPPHNTDTFNAPFLQLRWKANGLGSAQPYVEWTTKAEPAFGPDRRFYFDPVDSTDHYVHTAVPVYKHPKWTGEITQMRIGFGNASPGAEVIIQAFFTQYDTRHDINGQCFIRGCVTYFEWTRDINFLRRNINRMRTALRYTMSEFDTLNRKYVYNTWVGHDGRSGIGFDKDGNRQVFSGHGIGDNYWDLLPFGNKDFYATMLYYNALHCMARVEQAIREHPEWNVPVSESAFDPAMLTKHAAEVKAVSNKLFWDAKSGRFIPGIDADEKTHDYGFTFLNLEAIYYDFATPEHAKTIMSWINGDRIVEGDTSQGKDIYHWRFAPRATVKRNVEFYFWVWSGPETIPWGGQVQDGGAVLGFSYHDIMARLAVLGPDNAWARLKEILAWFDEVQAAGGYRKYYDGSREGSLQGGGTAGGLGLDMEFSESVLVPTVMLDGFLGFRPLSDGFALDPKLPSDWPELAIDRIGHHGNVLTLRATRNAIEVSNSVRSERPSIIRLPRGKWKASYIGEKALPRQLADGSFEVDWSKHASARFDKQQ